MPPRKNEHSHGRKAMVVGASGFVGKHLSQRLGSTGWTLHGFDRDSASISDFRTTTGDLFDRSFLARTLTELQPSVIFHLAGILKSNQPEDLYRVHVLGTEALCDAVLAAGIKPLIVIASSSAVYGAGHGSKPISEGFKPRPATHYAISKLAQEMIALRYYQWSDLPVIIVRAFNIIGPGQPASLACSAFAQQIAMAELHGNDFITVGDLSAQRDFVDVRDVASAYEKAALFGRPGQIYNVCSGRAVSIRKCLEVLMKLTPRSLRVFPDPHRTQNLDVSVQIGNAERFRKVSGWQPVVSLQSALADLLNFWRQEVKHIERGKFDRTLEK